MQGVFDLSNGQVQDLMFLREVYILKECELKMQQAALTACVQNHSPDPIFDTARVANIGTELRVNAAQSHHLVQRLCWAMYFGVRCQPDKSQLRHKARLRLMPLLGIMFFVHWFVCLMP